MQKETVDLEQTLKAVSEKPEKSVLAELKEQANLLGIAYPANANVAKMTQLIKEYRAQIAQEANTDNLDLSGTVVPNIQENVSNRFSDAPRGKSLGQLKDEAFKLIRCRVTVNNPSKQQMEGQIITVGNDVIGTASKFIPFQPMYYENGYHIPKIIVDYMKEMTHTRYPKKKDNTGATLEDHGNVRLVKDFIIEELPTLTEEGLRELAEQQSATRSLEDD